MDNELELVETDKLIAELLRRFDHCVFAGAKNANTSEQYVHVRWSGNYLVCAGLGSHISYKLVKDVVGLSRNVVDESG